MIQYQTTPFKQPFMIADNDTDLIQNMRMNLVKQVLTEQGLRDYLVDNYGVNILDMNRIHGLLNHLVDHYLTEKTDYRHQVEVINDRVLSLEVGAFVLFREEMHTLLKDALGMEQGPFHKSA